MPKGNFARSKKENEMTTTKHTPGPWSAAAPELLRLLVDIEHHLSGGPLHPDGMIFEEDQPALAVIRAAIAKAEGFEVQ